MIKSLIKRRLLRHLSSIAQAGQDYWIYGEAFNERRNGFFVDIGSYDGVTISNTYLLERRYDWDGICIEANPDTFAKLRTNRTACCVNACLDADGRTVAFAARGDWGGIIGDDTDNRSYTSGSPILRLQTRTLESVLKECATPKVIDYLSIDVEGAEERILLGFDFSRYQFRCITIERPTERLRELFTRHGYVLLREIPGLDCLYVHGSFVKEYKRNLLAYYQRGRLTGTLW